MRSGTGSGGRAGRCAGRAGAGFSLIEILVVITIIGLLMTLGFGPIQNALENGKVTKCRKHLADMGQGLLTWRDQRNKGRWPKESGIRFLLKLHQVGELRGRNAETFLCPGTEDRNDSGASGEPGSSYEDWENIDSTTISLAALATLNVQRRARNFQEHDLIGKIDPVKLLKLPQEFRNRELEEPAG